MLAWCWRRNAVSWHFFHGELGPRMTGNTHWTEQLIVQLLCNLTHHLHIFLKVWKRCCQINPIFLETHLHPKFTLVFLQPLNSVNLCCGEGHIYIETCHKMSWEEERGSFQECSSFHRRFWCKQVWWNLQWALCAFHLIKWWSILRSEGRKRLY